MKSRGDTGHTRARKLKAERRARRVPEPAGAGVGVDEAAEHEQFEEGQVELLAHRLADVEPEQQLLSRRPPGLRNSVVYPLRYNRSIHVC